MISIVFTLFVLFYFGIDEANNAGFLKKLAKIEADHNQGKFVNTNNLIIAIEKAKGEKPEMKLLFKFLALPFILLILIVLFKEKPLIMNKFYPLYNFCWGDYLEEFNRIEKRRNVILWFIVSTLILGVVINLISNYIWERTK